MAAVKLLGKLPKKLVVLREDIRKGKQDNVGYCPIALSLRRQFKGLKDLDVSVSGSLVRVSGNIPVQIGKGTRNLSVEITAELGRKADTFVSDFDNKRSSVRPISFPFKPDTIDLDI